LDRSDGGNYYWAGRNYLGLGDPAAALRDFGQAIERLPEDSPEQAAAYRARAATHLELKAFAAAVADFSEAISLDPTNPDTFYWRGQTYWRAQDYAAAIADFSEAIALDPNHLDSYYWRGRAEIELAEYPAALLDFTTLISAQPADSANFQGRGVVHLKLGDTAAAITDLGRAVDLAPKKVTNYTWRGQAHFEAQDFAAALVDFTIALELQPERVYSYAWRGRVYLALNDVAKAENDFAMVEEFLTDLKQAEPLYLVACGYGERSHLRPTLTWLRRTFERERSYVAKARRDPSFDTLREAPDFARLLAEFGAPAERPDSPGGLVRRLFAGG
jgi:tetratricopeptide (TPR) repeat protein